MSKQQKTNDKSKAKLPDYIEHVQDILGFQASNGLLTKSEAESIQKKLQDAMALLASNPNEANTLARDSFYELVEKLNQKRRCLRLLYMYGLHIWLFLISLAIVLLVILINQTLNFSIFQDIPMDAIVWGGLGGCAYSMFYLRKNIYAFELSKYYAVYYFVYPFAGMIFGLAIVFAVSSGLLSLKAQPSYAIYASIAFLAGTFQQWVLSTLKDIAEAIHKTE